MLSGSTIMACLLLAVNAGAPDVSYMNVRSFGLPIRIDEGRRGEIQQMRMFLSRDGGNIWNQLKIAPRADQPSYPFTALEDGAYWFAVAIVDQYGKQEPAVLNKDTPCQKIVVDTTPPEIKVQATRKDDKILVEWRIWETPGNEDRASLKLEYMLEGTSTWVRAAIEHPAFVSSDWFPAPPGGCGVRVRLTLADLAKNVGTGEATVPGTTPLAPPPPVDGVVGKENWSPDKGPPVRPVPTELPISPPPIGSGSLGQGSPSIATASASAYVAGEAPSRSGLLPPTTVVRNPQVRIEFDVVRCGPSGLGTADIYRTQDEGLHWVIQETVPLTSVNGNPGMGSPLRAAVMLTIPGEKMVYGFYVVVKSRAGLGEQPPSSGRPPQMRLELDTELPRADLMKPMPDPNQPNCVVFSWKATDRNLESTPILLEYGDTPNGPWKTIGPGLLPNIGGDGHDTTGKFSWQVPYDIPDGKAYLKLTVRDQAGNAAVAVTAAPVTFDTMVPSAQAGSFVVKVPGQ